MLSPWRTFLPGTQFRMSPSRSNDSGRKERNQEVESGKGKDLKKISYRCRESSDKKVNYCPVADTGFEVAMEAV